MKAGIKEEGGETKEEMGVGKENVTYFKKDDFFLMESLVTGKSGGLVFFDCFKFV